MSIRSSLSKHGFLVLPIEFKDPFASSMEKTLQAPIPLLFGKLASTLFFFVQQLGQNKVVPNYTKINAFFP
jgi:hypothetical protein